MMKERSPGRLTPQKHPPRRPIRAGIALPSVYDRLPREVKQTWRAFDGLLVGGHALRQPQGREKIFHPGRDVAAGTLYEETSCSGHN